MHHSLDSCCQYDFKLQVSPSEYGCWSGLYLMFVVFHSRVVSPLKQSMIFHQPLFWNLKIILIGETKKEPPIFPQRPSYWPTYPHCDSTLKLYITHQLTLSRTVLQSAGHHFFLPMQPQWHTNTHEKKRSSFTHFHQTGIRKNGYGSLHQASRWGLHWEKERKGKGEEGCSNDNLTTRLCGT